MTTSASWPGAWPAVAILAVGIAIGAVLRDTVPAATAVAQPARLNEEVYFGVRVGMMVPYFGNHPPSGFVWADGTSRWPDAPWVPDHLKNQNVPDMRGQLIGGALEQKAVGREWKEGQIKYDDIKLSVIVIKGALAKLPPSTVFPTQNQLGLVSTRMNTPDETTHGGANTGLTLTRIEVPSYEKGEGKLTVPAVKLDSRETSPRHLMCNWVIRLR